MKIPTRPRQQGLRFNITPLIDVVFLLIIFFLVASHFVRTETMAAIELPQATQTEREEEERARRLAITIMADRTLQVGNRPVELEAVEQMILAGAEQHQERFEVHIRADRTVPYRVVQPLLIACARANVTNVKFAVLQK